MRPILIKPLITEKMNMISEKESKFGFIVDINANKNQIKRAINDQYGVNVVKVNTMNYDGKKKTRNTKTGLVVGRTKAYKKAIVKLAEGEMIDFYEHI